MAKYCTREDLHTLGRLPRGVLSEQAVPIASVDATGDTLEVADHGLEAGTPAQLAIDVGATLPTPLATGTVYYVKPVPGSDSLIQLAASAGGAAIDLTDSGSGSFGLVGQFNTTRIDRAIEKNSAMVDQYLPTAQVPLDESAVPIHVKSVVARMSARDVLADLGRRTDLIDEGARTAAADLQSFRSGVPLRGENKPTASGRSRVWYSTSRGWAPSNGGAL